jgi:hypothetical protein
LKKFIEFTLSLAAIPFLLPWYLSEKLFEYLVQPLVFRRYRLEIGKRKKLVARILAWSLPVLLSLPTWLRPLTDFICRKAHSA